MVQAVENRSGYCWMPGDVGRTDFVISSGTGRFAKASGTIKACVTLEDFESPVTWVLEGTMEY